MKKGFTLVEVIACITILAIMSLLLIPKVLDTVVSNEEDLYKQVEKELEDASIKYLLNNYTSSNTITLNKSTLISSGLVSKVYDFTDESECNFYVVVSNINTTATAKAYISCTNYQTSGYTS